MLFNSLTFLIFFIVFYSLYYFVKNSLKYRNILILIGSYVFYAYFDYRFLSLLIISSLLDFWFGKKIALSKMHSKKYLIASLLINFGILGFFKYFNFFYESIQVLLNSFGLSVQNSTLTVILPVGISFYTFQSVGYVVDVYRKTCKPCESLLNYCAFIAFFPQLVAGPIERATHLLQYINNPYDPKNVNINFGLQNILAGLFKKILIADKIAPVINPIINSPLQFSSLEVLVAFIGFAFQIYCDFSGYTDIARGLAKIMGFDLMKNFNQPYLAINPQDFWKRWHISLSTFLRDYLYVSLGGNRIGRGRTYLNLIITMTIGGLWHGAGWNFVLWGFFHGFWLVLHRLFAYYNQRFIPRSIKVLTTFSLVLFSWILFRCNDMKNLGEILESLFRFTASENAFFIVKTIGFMVAPVIVYDWFCEGYFSKFLSSLPRNEWIRSVFFYVTIVFIVSILLKFGNYSEFSNPFIYFQF